ncbi:hypothetical protein RE474_11485 [Methanolobus sediminis]|uniref:Guanylate cyclase domain-containing protein n=1 Tax=Methanolobus sediminis TaxID=3072978 RepID=A0AA51UMG2_9EURY|nr:hypothetical protein [Methanolobus sediminis]WMW24695.1 hypothetical protein RE474_11485 [Methanolobus sediminis]
MSGMTITKKPLNVTFTFLAFADILGYTGLLKKCSNNPIEANDELNKIYEALHEGLEYLKTPDEKGIIKIFTDNLLLKYPNTKKLEDIEANDCIELFELLSYYQLSLALKGYFVRGAVAVGYTYVDEEIAFGYPIVEAHNLESETAINPRIIISTKVYKLVRFFADHWTTKGDVYTHFLLKDKDGHYFINYLAILYYNRDETNLPKVLEYLKSHKTNVEKELKSPHSYDVISKYEWVANYHDFFCQTYYPEDETLLINYENKSEFEFFRI